MTRLLQIILAIAFLIVSSNSLAMHQAAQKLPGISQQKNDDSDFDLGNLPRQCEDLRLELDDDFALIPMQCAERVLDGKCHPSKNDKRRDVIATALHCIQRDHQNNYELNFDGIRPSFAMHRDKHIESLLLTHRLPERVIHQEEKIGIEKEVRIFLLHNEITRELLIRNIDFNPEIARLIASYKNSTRVLAEQIARNIKPSEEKMKHHARHIWGECVCKEFPVDRIPQYNYCAK